MRRINLALEEREILQKYFKTSPIELMREGGPKIKDIAMSQLRTERTIGGWIKDFTERRLPSLSSGLAGATNGT
jgi:hypothetical protein